MRLKGCVMMKALLVDDEKLVRKGMIAMMPWREFDIEVVGDVNSGEKALEFLQSNQVDILFTDLSMPHMSGMELAKKVTSLYPETSIVILTFHQEFELIQDALRMGVIDYILKTQLDKEELENILSRIVTKINCKRAYHSIDSLCENKNAYEDSEVDLRQKWHDTDWIFKDYEFNKLVEETNRRKLPIAVIETIVYSVRNMWEHIFPFMLDDISGKNRVKLFENWDECLNWLKYVRLNIQNETIKAQYGKEITASIMKAVQIINGNDSEEMNQEDVARQVNMSRSYFSQCFKNIVGKSFNEYVREIKIKKAQVLLSHSQKPVYWIAEKLGYQDEKYFSRLFCEHTGMLPTEYRSNYTKKE